MVNGDLVQAAHHRVGVDGAVDFDGQALPGELVDDVEALDGPSVCGLVELEVEGPHDVGSDRAHGPDQEPCSPEGLLPLLIGHSSSESRIAAATRGRPRYRS